MVGATPAFADRPEDGQGGRVVPMRLQKFLGRAGVASRRGSEDLMTAGRVCVNGAVVTELGAKVDPLIDVVTVDGVVVVPGGEAVLLVMNKPAGYVTTMFDPQGRPTVADLMPDSYPGLFPVGRLDRDTEGVLLLMTDGELGARLLHPSHHVEKTYHAVVEGVPDESDLTMLREGLDLDDGRTAPAQARVVSHTTGRAVVELTIHEGRKRQVRRMLSAISHPVQRLERVAFGPVTVKSMERGGVRPLTSAEVSALREAAGL